MLRIKLTFSFLFTLIISQNLKAQSCKADFDYWLSDSPNKFEFYNQGSSGSGYSYLWNFGDGQTSTLQSPVHFYSSNGNYNVCVEVKNSISLCSDTLCKKVVANKINPCKAEFSTFQSNNNYLDWKLTALDSSEDYYTWQNNSSSISNSRTIVYNFSSQGTYNICLSVMNKKNHCKDTICHNIYVSPCKAKFSTLITQSSKTVDFTNLSSSNITDYTWIFGDGNSSNTKNPSHAYSNPGKYWVTLIAKDSKAKCQDSTGIVINITFSCLADFSTTLDFDSGDYRKVIFKNLSSKSSNTDYLWDFGDGNSSTQQNPTHSYDEISSYKVCLKVTDKSQNCSDNICKSVGAGIACEAYPGYGGIGYRCEYMSPFRRKLKWDFGDGGTSSVHDGIYYFKKIGMYKICLTVYCSKKDSATKCLDFPVGPQCNAKFYVSPDTANKFKLFLINKSSNTSTTTYKWNFGDGGTSTDRNPSHKYNKFGKFIVCLTVNDIDDNKLSCSSTYCDTLGLDSNGKLLKAGFWDIVVKEYIPGSIKKAVKSDFKIYPNPAKNKVSIDLSSSTQQYNKLEILNVNGQICLNQLLEIGNETIEVNLETLRRGLYLIKLSSNEGYSYTKMMKE